MPTNNTRDAAAGIAQRIKTGRTDPSQIDEAGRAPNDRPPGYAEVLMSETPTSVEQNAQLSKADWDVIELALTHYATCEGKT